MNGLTGREPKYPVELADEIRRRYRLWAENKPTRIAADLNLPRRVVHDLALRERKHHVAAERRKA